MSILVTLSVCIKLGYYLTFWYQNWLLLYTTIMCRRQYIIVYHRTEEGYKKSKLILTLSLSSSLSIASKTVHKDKEGDQLRKKKQNNE